jgi:hypothetical protein
LVVRAQVSQKPSSICKFCLHEDENKGRETAASKSQDPTLWLLKDKGKFRSKKQAVYTYDTYTYVSKQATGEVRTREEGACRDASSLEGFFVMLKVSQPTQHIKFLLLTM